MIITSAFSFMLGTASLTATEPAEPANNIPQNKPAYNHKDLQKFMLLQEMAKMHGQDNGEVIPEDITNEMAKKHAEVIVAYQEAEVIADRVEILRGAFGFELFVLDRNDHTNNLVLQIVCKKHPRIVRIKISDCTKITNLSSLHGLKNLQHIYMNGCTRISEEQIEALQQALPKLKIQR